MNASGHSLLALSVAIIVALKLTNQNAKTCVR